MARLLLQLGLRLATGVLSAAGPAHAAGIWYVDADAPQGNTCLSWADACDDLQTPLAFAEPGDEIWVADGTYKPDRGTGDRESTFQLTSGVAVYGGFTGGETTRDERHPTVNLTILSGDLNGDDGPDFANTGENSYHVVTGSGTDSTAILDGFVITAGNADGAFGSPNSSGSGMYNEDGNPTVVGCTFIGNYADFGGAMFNRASRPTLINCRFIRNAATFGGAMSNEPRGSDNEAPTLINGIFYGNSADLGGAMVNWNGNSPAITNCTFTENVAVDNGGAIANVKSSVILTNCILWGNSDSGGLDESAQIYTIAGTPTVGYSCVQGGWTGSGTNNISDDPLFVSPADGDLHLQDTSPCIDAGDDSAVTIDTDLDENPRIAGSAVDMGAYESPVPVPTVSEWGVVTLALLLLTACTLVLRNERTGQRRESRHRKAAGSRAR